MFIFKSKKKENSVTLWKNECKRLEQERNAAYAELESIKKYKEDYEGLIEEAKSLKKRYETLINQTEKLVNGYKQELDKVIQTS